MGIRILCFTVFLFLSFLSNNVQAQKAGDSRYVYRHWDNKRGLPQNTVNDLVKDAEGYLWAATEEGLVRFDGLQFMVRHEGNTPGLYSPTFYDLSPSRRGIWAASRNTLVHITKNGVRTIDFRNHLQGAWIRCLEEDRRGRLWVGTSTGGLFLVDGDSVAVCPGWAGREAGMINTIRAVEEGVLVGSARGLWRLSPGGALQNCYPAFKGKEITALAVSPQQTVWVGTAQHGLYGLHQDLVTVREQEGLRDRHINSLAVAADGNVWIGTRHAGYQVYAEGKLSTPFQAPVADDGIKSILPDGELTWLGTTSSGLVQARAAEVLMIPHEGLSGSIVLPIYQHPSGEVWVGTAGKGLHRIKDQQVTPYSRANGLSHDLVLTVYGRGDAIYAGTGNGMDRINRKTGKVEKHYSTNEGLLHNTVQALFCDSRQRLWISTRAGGIQYLVGECLQTLDLPERLRGVLFLSFFEDSRGQLWLGSRGAGAVRIDTAGKIAHFDQESGLPADVVYSCFEDRNGGLWMATDKGLVSYYRNRLQVFDKKNGLHFNEMYRLMEDGKGYLWCSGNFGLQRIALADLQGARDRKQSDVRLQVRLFNQVDGMTNAETNGGIFPAGWKMQDGSLWFPTVEGIAVADPAHINEAARPLTVQLQNLHYGGQWLAAGGPVQLPAGAANLEIHYTSIDFSKAEDIRYYYRLRGQQEEWVAAGDRRAAYFSGLPPGEYQFEVKAEQYGTWSPTVSLTLIQNPWFYQTLWFRALLAAALVAGVLALIRGQRRKAAHRLVLQKNITRAQITGQEKERQVIGEELHDNINQQLTTVKLYLDLARSHEAMRLAMVEKSEQVVQKVINEIRGLCKSLIPPTLKDIGLRESLRELVQSYTVANAFRVHFYSEVPLDELAEDIRFSLFRITQEQLTNIARHAEASEVWIEFRLVNQTILLTIRDDGKGFSAGRQPEGVGLANIRHRLELFNGSMAIRSSPGQGCQLEIRLPVESGRYAAVPGHREQFA